jgi:magnesium transporter
MPADEAAALLAPHVPRAVVRAWEALAADFARAVLEHLPAELAHRVLAEAEPAASAAVLTQLEPEARERLLRRSTRRWRASCALASYPQDSAGRLMDARVIPLRAGMTVGEAIERLRACAAAACASFYVVDDAGRLAGRVEMQDLALAERDRPLAEIMRGVPAVVRDLDPREEVVDILQREPISVLPVVNQAGRLLGVIRQAKLMAAVEEEASVDIQTMVGASPDERALSRPLVRGAQAPAVAADQPADGVPRRGGGGCSRAPSRSSPRSPCCCRWWRASRATPARRRSR